MSSVADAKRIDAIQKTLFDILKGSRVGGDQNYTHNAMALPKGKFMITQQNVAPYYRALCDLVEVDGQCGIMEKDEPRMPVIVDNDFDFEPEPTTGAHPPIMYEHWVVTEEIKAYQEAIKQYCDVKNNKSYICCVFEKPGGYMKKGAVHNGFHLMFPFAVTDADDQQATLTPLVKTILKKRGILEKMKAKDVKPEGWDLILDPGLPKKTWIQYGCRKDSNSSAYKLTAIYDHNMQQISVADAFDPRELRYVHDNMVPMSFFDGRPPEYFLPIFLSVRAWDSYIPLKDEIKALMPTEAARKKRIAKVKAVAPPVSAHSSVERKAKLKEIKELMEMLHKRRADGYDTWMPVGWALYTITNGSTDGLELWNDFSKRSEKFEDGKCDEQWESMTLGNWSIGSLKYWAQEDSPEKYKAWRKTEEGCLMNKALSLSNFDVAKFVQKMYEGRFACASLRHVMWYEFKNHRWHTTDKGASLYDKMSNQVVDRLDQYCAELSAQIVSLEDEEEKELLKARITKIYKLQGKLKDTTFKNKMMSELSVLYFDPHFLERLDNNVDLLVFNNGVLDVKLGALRPGIPEDYCSKCTKIDFPVNYNKDTPEVREMEDYLRKVFPTDGLRKYFKRFAASTLRGGNPSKILPEWVGQGDNSKSAITECFVQMYGDYCVKLPSTFFTGKSGQSSACTPELERAQGARIGFIQEPDGSEKLNLSKAKEVTGEPSIYSRGLYKEGRDVKMMMKWIIVCNIPLKIPSNERAIWGRLRLLPFLATFCRDPRDVPTSIEEQYRLGLFPADPFFNDKIPRLAQAFAWLLWQEYPLFVKEGLCEPIEVTEATEQYRTDTDAYAHFIKEKIEPRKGAKLTVVKLFKTFAAWYKINFPSIQVPARTEMRDSVNRLFKKPLPTETWFDIDIKPDEGIDMDNLLVVQVDVGQ
jgi:phage/plasmid-associated DNA primase